MARSFLLLVTDDADLVAVRIAQVGAVVVGMIVRAQAGRTLVLAAGLHACLVGGVDARPVGRVESDGDTVAGARLVLVEWRHDPELWPAVGGAEARGVARIVGLA